MPHDSPSNASVLSLVSGEGRPSAMTAKERAAFEAGRAAAQREMMRERFGHAEFAPEPPMELSPTARKYWDQALKGIPLPLRRAGIEDALCRYAVAMATFERATAELDRQGLLICGRQDGVVKNPLVSVRTSAMTAVREARRDLGLPGTAKLTLRRARAK